MKSPEYVSRSNAPARGKQAEEILAKAFSKAGWRVNRHPERRSLPPDGSPRPDMVVSKGNVSYAVEVKAASEGRSDRVIPLWSQACLQAVRAAGPNHAPLAVVAAPRIARSAAEQVLKFAAENAPDAAVGVMDFAGLRLFRGPHLEGLDSDEGHLPPMAGAIRSDSADLFSDLNQWMLKVLLAPELPEALLSAPRGRYRNASQLARAANVSVMSAFRLVQQLQRGGYLHESSAYLSLVRREDLFRSWQASGSRRVSEMPMRFALRGDPKKELDRMLRSGHACLAMFAAAKALHFGFVQGVPPHVYVQRLRPGSATAWKNLIPVEGNDMPDLILRQAPAPQSVFRGLVRVDGMPVSDILQVWLDVSVHPSRGHEQAEFIRRHVLGKMLAEQSASG
jgi:hypothetical protein